MTLRLHSVRTVLPDLVASAALEVETRGAGFTEITRELARFLGEVSAGEGAIFVYLRHTSASLTIQEHADTDVQTDLMAALGRLAPESAAWVHDMEGPDDMPAHVKAMLTGVSLHVPVKEGSLALGRWQGIYLIEHRAQPHRREVLLHFIGTGRKGR